MGQSGVMVDPQKREEFRGFITKQLGAVDEEIQESVPKELRPFKPRRKVPADAVLGEPRRSSIRRVDPAPVRTMPRHGERTPTIGVWELAPGVPRLCRAAAMPGIASRPVVENDATAADYFGRWP